MTARKIVQLKIDNVMRLQAVEITPNGGVQIIGGDNAQGKTSVLDSIAMAIGGKKLCPPEPIRHGEESAEITVQLGDLTITREFNIDGKNHLTVRNAAGEPLKRPQAILDDLYGSLAFDPLEFATMGKADAARTLRELVGLDVEQEELELARVFALRTEKGRDKRAAEAVVADMPWFEDVGERRSVTEIGQRMAAAVGIAQEHEELIGARLRNTQREEAIKDDIDKTEQEIARKNDAIDRMRDEADALRTKKTNFELQLTAARVRWEQAARCVDDHAVPDIAPIQAELDGVEKHNEKVTANEKREDRVQFAEQEAAAWKTLDTKHNEIATSIRKQTEAIKYPITGLELRREGVFFQDVPFEQGSRAERIKVSLAMGMAMNDKMRVLLIRDGSVLDDESMKIIQELASAHDFQFFIEMARGYEDQAGAIIISDGEVVS